MNSMWTVYVLKCTDGTYYTGCTSDMTDRLNRHNKGQVKYTSSRLPVDLIVTINFNDKYKAYDFENYLKSGSGKAFMNKRFI
jgi:putative endonuclease